MKPGFGNLQSQVDLGTEVFVSAAEPSADAHAALLIREVLRLRPSLRVVGVAGPKMIAAGCRSIFDMTSHATMLLGAVGQAGRAGRMLTACYRYFQQSGTQAVVVVDSPVLHLPLAAVAKSLGLPVLYYIAPQVWAWRESRISKIRQRVDRLAVILPFEEAYFRERGIDARFVGHPLSDARSVQQPDEAEIASLRATGKPLIALLPGSRKQVIRSVLPGQLEVAEKIAQSFPNAAFLVSAANADLVEWIKSAASRTRATVRVLEGSPTTLIRAADLVLVASGTMTLEVALHRRPMIVMYNASPWFAGTIGRALIRTPYLSLPNILAGSEAVPEFMPFYRSTQPIAETALEMLHSPELCESQIRNLEPILAPLRAPGASQRTAEMLLEMMDERSAGAGQV